MKAKTIKAVLRKKIDDWIASITDPDVRAAVKKNTIVTGGAIASMLLGEKVSDYDLYFRSADVAEVVANYYVKLFKLNPPPRFADGRAVPITVLRGGDRIKIVVKSAGIAGEESGDVNYRYFEQAGDPADAEEFVEKASEAEEEDALKPRYRPIFLSSNAITLSNGVQCVIRFHGEPDSIHENYDFVHCMNYWDSKDGTLVLHPEALECLLARELRYKGSLYPLCSVIRTRKFIQRGWSINAGQYLKMLMQVSRLDLSNLDVLEEQLVGVDAAYFLEIISLLRARQAGGKTIDDAYLTAIIDKMF